MSDIATCSLRDFHAIRAAASQQPETPAERVELVLLREATGWDRYGRKQLARTMRDLDRGRRGGSGRARVAVHAP
ncbi:hypothetical protein OG978_01840 [Streptomyces sp. NBC_01591]|uniref:hypothetical protein n=1 Tax=Streptomyces sp. NBC_01591 TaxID=2975888 RepID=UPI002DD79DDB|nr:hypothetical protein [Streptomyces sp. NBC_01591]WSD66278.1 hypothetical protein OG978_01840 [Streptomyces sp. NBC_01591]